MNWKPLATFTTTARDDRSPPFTLPAGLIIVEYTYTPRAAHRPPYLCVQVDHQQTGLEYHTFLLEDRTSPPGIAVTGRRPLSIAVRGPYTIGVHTDSITRVTVRLLVS